MQPLVSLDEQEAHTFSDLRRVLGEQREALHLLRLLDRVVLSYESVMLECQRISMQEVVEVHLLGRVTVSMEGVV